MQGTVAGDRRATPPDRRGDVGRRPGRLERASGGSRGLLGVPLAIDGDVFGVACIGSVRVSDFSASERTLFTAVANRAASAVDRVRSRRRVEQAFLEAERVARREAEVAERRQRFLAEVSSVLASSLDIDATVGTVVRMAVPEFADWCALDFVGDDGLVSRRAVAHAEAATDVDWERFAQQASAHFDVARVVETKSSLFGSRSPSSAPPGQEESAALGPEPELVSWIVAPLRRPKRALGALLFASTRRERAYSEANLAFAEEVAVRIAMAVENADLYRRAQAAIRIREDFVSIASHELKTPLTPLETSACTRASNGACPKIGRRF